MAVDTRRGRMGSVGCLGERKHEYTPHRRRAVSVFDRLAAIMDAARQCGLRGPETIETNAFWATNLSVIREQLGLLTTAAWNDSRCWDPFHAESHRPRMCQTTCGDGPADTGAARVLVRWEKYLQEPVSTLGLPSRQARWRAAVQDFPCRFTGRAAGELAELFADKDADAFRGLDCLTTFLSAKGVHVDPYGNVFSGLCSGIIVGSVERTPLDAIWREFDPRQLDVVGTLVKEGPWGLLQTAEALGYHRPAFFAGKCHLCARVRNFFFDNGGYEMIIGPSEVYGRYVPRTESSV